MESSVSREAERLSGVGAEAEAEAESETRSAAELRRMPKRSGAEADAEA